MKCPYCGNTTYFSLNSPSNIYEKAYMVCEVCHRRQPEPGQAINTSPPLSEQEQSLASPTRQGHAQRYLSRPGEKDEEWLQFLFWLDKNTPHD